MPGRLAGSGSIALNYSTSDPAVGLEEDVLVTSAGVEWLSTPQRELWLVA